MQRVVAIMESVASAQPPATPARVSAEIGLSLSTVSRIMRDLAEDELLDRLVDGSYLLGSRMFRLVRTAQDGADAIASIHRVLADLRDRTGETASLNVRRGDTRVCVASMDSKHELRRVVPVGDAIPLVGTATGDVLLAGLPDKERQALVAKAIPDAAARVAALTTVRETASRGWSFRSDGLIAGVTGLAAPVRWQDSVLAALTLSGPSARLTEQTVRDCVPDLQAAAQRIAPWVQDYAVDR